MKPDLAKYAGKADEIRTLVAKATVSEMETLTPEVTNKVQTALKKAGQHEASLPPFGENNKPRMLKITTWIAHGGTPNQNRDAFVTEELEEIVKDGLFAPPYFGMIDFNHDFLARGAYYNTRFAFNPQAGEYGIMAEGAIWAWAYEEEVDRLLAMQARNGFIDVSMAALPRDVEVAEDEKGTYFILHDPIFFTASVLDVPPADPHARGLGTEDTIQTTREREEALLGTNEVTTSSYSFTTTAGLPWALSNESTAGYTWPHGNELKEAKSDTTQEVDMDEKVIAEIKAALEEANGDLLGNLTELVEAASRLPTVEAELETVNTNVTELNETIAELTTKVEEKDLTINTLEGELTEANNELTELRAFKAEKDAEAEAAELAELRESRLADLSEAARTALEKRDEEAREQVIAHWLAMDEDKWKFHLDAMNIGKDKFSDKSNREGTLVTDTGSRVEGKYGFEKFIRD